jgi:hypothetical protein
VLLYLLQQEWVPSVIAQQEEETSLGEEDLAGHIISTVLDVSGDDEEENDDAADDEIVDQDSTDTATVNPNQEDQTVDQDDTVILGDHTNTQTEIPIIDQDQGAANLALNGALDVTVEPTPIPTPTPPPPDDGLPPEVELPRENGKIAFDSNRNGNWEIYVMNADGSGQTNIRTILLVMFTQNGAQLQTLTYKIAHPPVITLREDITEEAIIADRA